MSEAPYPPAEVPADGDWTSQVPPQGAPRYSASASVPVQPPPGNVPNQYGPHGPSGGFGQVPPPAWQPTTYGAQGGNAIGQNPNGQAPMGQAPMGQNPMGQAPMGQAPMGQNPMGQNPMGQNPMGQAPSGQAATGHARVGGSASVPGANSYAPPPQAAAPMPTTYGAAPQGYPSQPGVYGQPMGGEYGNQHPPQPQGPPGGPGGQGGAPQGFGPMPGAGQQGQMGQMGQMGQAYGQPAYAPPPAGQGDGRPRDKMAPTGGWPYVEQAEKPKSRKGMTIGLIVLAILVVAGVGGYVGLRLATRGDSYVVGSCVRQDGTEAALVECGASGAYKITQIVDNEAACPDTTQPSLLLTDGDRSRVACLGPATG